MSRSALHRRSLLTVGILAAAASIAIVGPSHPASADASVGTITGTTNPGMTVYADGFQPGDPYSSVSDADGHYTLTLPAGRYQLDFNPPSTAGQNRYANEWYGSSAAQSTSTWVTVPAGGTVSGIDQTLPLGASLSGTGPANGYELVYQDRDGALSLVRGDTTPATQPHWVVPGLPPGTYVVRWVEDRPSFQQSPYDESPSDQFYPTGDDPASATKFTLTTGENVGDIDVTAGPWVQPDVTRISAPDRFSMSALLAAKLLAGRATHTGGTVFLASGTTFPDALSAGPVAARLSSPVLLVQPDSIPQPVLDELHAIKPDNIVIAGGPAAVGAAVQTEAATIAPVERVSGADRYATSRALAQYMSTRLPTYGMVVASGRNFPDALAAGPVAAEQGSPLVTVDGTTEHADPDTTSLAADLGAPVVGAGGPAVLNTQILQDLGDINAAAYWGADRYATAAQLGATKSPMDPSFNTVYLTIGTNFPDALSATPLVVETDAALVTVRSYCAPATVLDAIRKMHVRHIVILGGTAAISDDIRGNAANGQLANDIQNCG